MRRALAALVAVVVLTACSASLDKARVTLTTTVRVENDVEGALMAAVQAKQGALLEQVKTGTLSPEEAQGAYDTWRAKFDKVLSALAMLHDAIAAAAHVLDAADAAKSTAVPLSSMSDVAQAFSALLACLADAGIHVPGVQ